MVPIGEKNLPAAVRPPRLVRGSLVILRRKCGKAACWCADGERLHENPALSVSDAGRTRIVALRPQDVAAVEAALARYSAARERLEADAAAGVDALRVWVAARRERERSR
jgi:hypothetical protein